MIRLARYLAPIAALAMLGGCGMKESVEDASREVARFHAALDAGRSQAIWGTTGPQFRQATQRATFERLLDAVHRKLGKVKDSKQVGWNANATTGGTFLTLTMQTTFERGSGTEQFVYVREDDKRLKLAGYHIESQDMLLD